MGKNLVTVFIVGDSTAADKSVQEKPMSGWGEFIGSQFDDTVKFENHAINGRSTQSFLKQNRLAPILAKAKPGDYLWIQFGHNDQKIDDPERFTKPYEDYMTNLKFMIAEAEKRQMTVVLLTSISRRQFVKGELNRQSLGEYPEAMRILAKKLDVLLVDMHEITSNYLSELGEKDSKAIFLHLNPGEHDNYPEGLTDNTHFSEHGAQIMARLLANSVSNILPSFALRKRVTGVDER
ncbi:rhamnogalacturonan acetylesterase [Marinilactibacillus kalidii]|uniref:rhamnogalacturonan acetylesterase n=1 Tax=Marinilactibacillus kalidii TaxID=2820274 RepID=UPI001ABDA4C6|nr:rhamnogalacturonan acetylesterase [Marinilactibacillus kalidii]